MSILSVPSFTNLGYLLHARDFEPIEVDLTGKTVIVTGSTGGLGRQAAGELAGLGAKTVVIGRSPEKLEAARDEIEGEVLAYEADLSLFDKVRKLADRLEGDLDRIDVLINNVGVLLPEREVTSEGVEKTLATNLAGHFLLTNLLMPKIIDSAPARIINVTSGGMYTQRISISNLQSDRGEYKGAAAYARTKRGQMILTELWAERLRGTGVTVNAMHPGWAKTSGVEGGLPVFNAIMQPLLRTAEQGADTMVWLAAAEEPSNRTGLLWFDRRPVPAHLTDNTKATEAKRHELWQALSELTGVDMPEGLRLES